ncbi:4Fe-4S dicluster domain-containing protein [Desulfurobacterium atlanticum]|uniref:2Fe-2S iron-sulfur cluster binding domain-containing protein n=1 Tax=Desulfurobacterium atlanticum TaxID=240169 RepID=A0A238XW90_9BACT|nr:4Fe-4S dicluster domain-containing protein [Desulfurobacterium atlanticum]SNR62791.1 2Fe-2S iron-sulfur cluster binding domain-containing protein [Desulfurobacterium atlanticum]
MPDKKYVSIFLEGRKIKVPEGYTVIEALWDTGHDIKRGVGCLSGLCGACAIAYLEPGGKRVKFGLGCQTIVKEGMNITVMPFFPSRTAQYNISQMERPIEKLKEIYPELYMCQSCGFCSVACPEWINVSKVMSFLKSGEYEKATEMMLDCILCGLCASRCPRGIAPQIISLFVQRAVEKERPLPENLKRRLAELEDLKYEELWAEIFKLDENGLREFCEKARKEKD